MSFLYKLLSKARGAPILTSSTSFGLLMPASCLTKQLLYDDSVNWSEVARYGVYGALLHGPLVHCWMGLMARSGLPILAKVCTDQFVFAPVIGTSFFLGLAVLDGKRDGLMALWQEKVPAAWATGLCVWPLLAGVSYTWVPMHLRPPFISVCSFFWFIFMAHLRSQTDPWEPPTLRLFKYLVVQSKTF